MIRRLLRACLRVQWLLLGGLVVVALAFVAWTLLRTIPNVAHMGWEGWRAMGADLVQKMQKKDAPWLPCLYLIWALVFWGGRWLWNRHLRLYITAQGLRQEHRMPLGLHHLFGQNWQMDWSEVRGITTRTTTGGAADKTWRELTTVRIVDDVIPALRASLRARFVRSKNTAQVRAAIRSQVMVELENKRAQEIIDSFGEVSVKASEDDPTVCLVEFSFAVAHGLNRIYLSAHITV